MDANPEFEKLEDRVLLSVAPSIEVFPIFISNVRKETPDVSGNVVIWRESIVILNPGNNYSIGSIYGYNLSTKEKFPICEGSLGTLEAYDKPVISGNTVVWTDNRNLHSGKKYPYNPNYDIFGFDLVTRKEFPVSVQEKKQDMPAIDGNVVVWRDSQNSIKALDISTGREFEPSSYSCGTRKSPAISGDIVVWARFRGDWWDIWEYNLANDTRRFVISLPNYYSLDDKALAVSGDIIIWRDWRNSNDINNCKTEIYGYNLTTGIEFPVCVNSAWKQSFDISGDIIVWSDNRRGGGLYDVFGYHIPTSTEFLIAENGLWPAIDGNLVVWKRGDDIYGAYVSGSGPGPDLGVINAKPKIEINGNATYTISQAVVVDLFPGDFPASEMRISFDKRNWTDWEQFSAQKPLNLLSSKIKQTVYAQFKNSVGDVSKACKDSIIYDNTLPYGTVLVDKGQFLTGSTSVVLSIKGKDTISGLRYGEVRCSFDNTNWSSWMPYQKTLTVSFEDLGAGRKVCYVQLKDSAGNIGTISDDFYYDVDAARMRDWIKLNKSKLVSSNVGDWFIHNWAFTYDQATAIQGLIAAQEYKLAGTLLNAMWGVKKRLGGMVNAARTDGLGIEWLVTSGPNAHAGIAYLKYYTDVAPSKTFLNKARHVGDFLLRLQNNNISEFSYGGIAMGPKGDPRYTGDQHPGYNPSAPGYEQIYSAEHNIDCFHLFDKLFTVTGDVKYRIARDKVLGFIEKMYDSDRKIFNMGYNERDDIVDEQIATDVQAWAISSLGAERVETITGSLLDFCDFIESIDNWCKSTNEAYCMTSIRKNLVSPEFSLEVAATKLQAANYLEGKAENVYVDSIRNDAYATINKMRELSQGIFHYCYYTDYTPADNADTGLGFRAQQGDSGISHFYLLNVLMGNDVLSEKRLF